MSLVRISAALFRREFALAWAGGGGALLPVGFFAGAASLAPLASGVEPDRIAAIGPAALWVALALSALLSAERLFQGELEDGSLDLLLTSGAPGALVSAIKCLAHWLAIGGPLALVAPALWLLLKLPFEALGLGIAALLIGKLTFLLIGGIAAALAVGVRRGALLIALLCLPLYAPTAIFGAACLYEAADGGWADAQTPFLLLASISLGVLALSPFAMAGALRAAID